MQTLINKIFIFIFKIMNLKNLLTTFFLLLSSYIFAGDYSDNIIKDICSCSEKIDSNQAQDKIYLKLGLCMLNASQPYAKELKRDYKIDLNHFNDAVGEKLGQIFGVKMAGVCPDILLKLYKKESKDTDEKESDISNKTIESQKGKITKIEENQFITVFLEDANGKTSKYLWLTFFPINKEFLNNPQNLLHKNVIIEFKEDEFLDPRIKEYINYRIITNISVEQE